MKKSADQIHHLVQNKSMTLIVSIIAGNVSGSKKFQNQLPNLSPLQVGKARYQITSHLGSIRLASVLNRHYTQNELFH